MTTYIMLGKYSAEGVKNISSERTKNAENIIKQLGGKVDTVFALLGPYDLIAQVQLPGTEEAMRASLELGRLTGISFTTMIALPVERFDSIAGGK